MNAQMLYWLMGKEYGCKLCGLKSADDHWLRLHGQYHEDGKLVIAEQASDLKMGYRFMLTVKGQEQLILYGDKTLPKPKGVIHSLPLGGMMFVLQTIPELKVFAVTDEKAAAKLAAKLPGLLVRQAKDLQAVPKHLLVRMYNATLPNSQAPVKEFANKQEGAERVWEVIGVLATEVGKKARAPSVPREPGVVGKIGKTHAETHARGDFMGQFIYKLVKENPRREGTWGWKSFGLVEEGMSFEDYLKAGGRRNDLAWDIAHGYVEMRADGAATSQKKSNKKTKAPAPASEPAPVEAPTALPAPASEPVAKARSSKKATKKGKKGRGK